VYPANDPLVSWDPGPLSNAGSGDYNFLEKKMQPFRNFFGLVFVYKEN
jgi:hypothetical protein